MTSVLPLPYFGNIYFYTQFLLYSRVEIEAHENYIKQTYRNRMEIATANGVLSLSIPVFKSDTAKQLYTDVRIEYRTPWQKIHLKALESAYMHTPYYEYYIHDFIHFFSQPYTYLFQLNTDIHKLIIELVGLKTDVKFTSDFVSTSNNDYIILREQISPKSDHWRNDPHFESCPYFQVFKSKHGFLPNLSILDLIFNEGPDTLKILNSCWK